MVLKWILNNWKKKRKILNHGSMKISSVSRIEDHLQSINDKIDAKQKEIDALKATETKEQVKDAETESGGDTTKEVSGKGWGCVLI